MDPYRIPIFAVCAVCGGHAGIAACARCRLLCCSDCRRGGDCAACLTDDQRAVQRALRHQRMVLVGEALALIGGVALSTLAAVAMLLSVGRMSREAEVAPVLIVEFAESPVLVRVSPTPSDAAPARAAHRAATRAPAVSGPASSAR